MQKSHLSVAIGKNVMSRRALALLVCSLAIFADALTVSKDEEAPVMAFKHQVEEGSEGKPKKQNPKLLEEGSEGNWKKQTNKKKTSAHGSVPVHSVDQVTNWYHSKRDPAKRSYPENFDSDAFGVEDGKITHQQGGETLIGSLSKDCRSITW